MDTETKIILGCLIAATLGELALIAAAIGTDRSGRAELREAMERLEQFRAQVPRSVFDPAEQL